MVARSPNGSLRCRSRCFSFILRGPLAVLVAESFSAATAPLLTHYTRFLGDRSTSASCGTLWLGVKATLLCLLFAYPLAWADDACVATRCARSCCSSSCCRSSPAWWCAPSRGSSSSAGQGVFNKALLALGLDPAAAAAPIHRDRRRHRAGAGEMPLMVLPIVATMSKIDPNLRDASRDARRRRVAHVLEGDAPALACRE